MIDRMFIQEEKTTLALDKQLAKEKPGERRGERRGGRGVPSSCLAEEFDLGAGGRVPEPDLSPPLGDTRAPTFLPWQRSTLTSGLWDWRELSWFSSIPVCPFCCLLAGTFHHPQGDRKAGD